MHWGLLGLEIWKMGSEAADSVDDCGYLFMSESKLDKVPRKVHKAEKEKLKRDHLNELFLDLSSAVYLNSSNNGKASILRHTIRILGELLSQVDNLKKENASLLSESNYVTIEKNELLEENSGLDAQIKTLRSEIDERANFSTSDYSQPHRNVTTQWPEGHIAMALLGHVPDPTSIMAPVYVTPLHNDSRVYPSPCSLINTTMTSNVNRPQPRYPSSSDSWPSHILTKHTDV